MLLQRAPRLPVAVAATCAAGVVGGAVLLEAVQREGRIVAAVPIGIAIAWWLVQRPAVNLALLVTTAILFEDDPQTFLAPYTRMWFRSVLGGLLTPTDLLLGVAVVGVAAHVYGRGRRIVSPGPFAVPMVLLASAIVFGVVNGILSGADPLIALSGVRVLAYLVVVPMLVLQMLTTQEEQRWVLHLIVPLAVLKGALGLFGFAIGVGRSINGDVLSYYSPTPNMLLMLFALGALAAAVTRTRVPRWVHVGAVVSLLTLVVSYRRSFWIATVVAVFLLLVVISGRRGRLLIAASTALAILGVWTALHAGGATTDTNMAVQRVRSLNPERIEVNADDRYRLDEQRNVYEEIRRHPLTGIGLGVPWTARYPLSMEFPGNRNYTHTTVLWYWLKLGPLGLAAYASLHLTAMATGLRVWRRSNDALLRLVGVTIATGIAGLAIAETTGSFTGVENRFTIAIAGLYGWLAAMRSTVSEDADDVRS